MAEQQEKSGRELRGGTQTGEAARVLDATLHEEGTPGITSPAGGVRNEPPSRHVARTGLGERNVQPDDRLAGGKTAEAILGYLGEVQFPARKDEILVSARRAGAPDDVVEALRLLTANSYDSAEALLRDYPGLPDRETVSQRKGAEPPA